MSQNGWEPEKMLHIYLHDYFMKKKLHETAKAFREESKVNTEPVAIDAPDGFLFEWWSVFWDLFIARTNKKHSEAATFYLEMQEHKSQEKDMQMLQFIQQEMQHVQQQQHNQQLRQAQLVNANTNWNGHTGPLARYGPIANSMAPEMCKDASGESALKRLDPNLASMLKTAGVAGHAPGKPPRGTLEGMLGNLQQAQTRNQQLPHFAPGLDQVRTGVLPSQTPMTSIPQTFRQHPLSRQHILQAQQNLEYPSAMDLEMRRMIMLNNRNMVLGKDGQLNLAREMGTNVGPSIHVGCPSLSREEADFLESPLTSAQLSHAISQPRRMVGSGSTMDGCSPNTFHGNDQAPENQMDRKWKHPVSSAGCVDSSGTANTSGTSPCPEPSTSHTSGDAMSKSALPHNGVSSKRSLMFGAEDTLASANNQLAEDATLNDNVEMFLSHEEGDPMETMDRDTDVSKGFTFTDIAVIQASTSKVNCCHFSPDGKLLATGGHDKKAVLWYTDTQQPKSTMEEHRHMITDVCFSRNNSWLVTSSFDKTVRVWSAENTKHSLHTFAGHSTSVWSLDFHPNREDLICSCDGNGEIRYWSINDGRCSKVFWGGMTQVRFQPRHGKYLAAAADNIISVLDVETQTRLLEMRGHVGRVQSICWDPSGEFLASVSEDIVRVWSVSAATKSLCIHQLSSNGNKFNSCVFHPLHPPLLIIGCYEDLELWNMVENKSMTLPAHMGLISTLAASNTSGLVASGSHDKCVKLWK